MPWVRIDENAMDHPKFLALSDGAWRLWCEGQSYCQKHLTDGAIPFSALKGFRYYSAGRLSNLLAENVPGKGPCWRQMLDRSIQVHDYLQWNESREQVIRVRELARQRIQKMRGRKRNGNGVTAANVTESKTEYDTRSYSGGVVCTEVSSPKEPSRIVAPAEIVPADCGMPPDESIRWFDKIYGVYPNKDRKQLANEAWIQLNPSATTAAAIHADILRRVKNGWVKYERRFIPQLRHYLAERQWEDAMQPDVLPPHEDDPFVHMPHAWQCGACGEIHEGTSEQHKRRICLMALPAGESK